MRNNYYILYSFIYLLILSCKPTENYNRDIIDFEHAVALNMKCSSIIDSIYFVKIETSEECLIKNIQQIFFDKEFIFVMDNGERLLVFNHDGTFLNQIGNMGKGPGEYIYISSFSVDTVSKTVYIHEGRRILSYNYNGVYKNFQITTNKSTNFFFHNKHFFCYVPEEILYSGSSTEYKITVFDSTGAKVNSFLPVTGIEGVFPMFISSGQFYSVGKETCLLDPNANIVYKVDPQSIAIKYRFANGNINEKEEYAYDEVNSQGLKQIDKDRNGNLKCKSIFENNHFLLVYYELGNKTNLAYINKKDYSIYNIKTEDNILGFENDLTGALPISSLIFLEDLFVTIIDPSEIFENSGKFNYSKLDNILSSISINDNPILRICLLKK